MTQRRATYNGELGANNEEYQRGQFIATSDKTLKGARPATKPTRKQEYEPCKWSVAPVDGQRALMGKYGQVWNWPAWRATGKMIVADWLNVEYFGADYLAQAAEAAERWNNGQRWE